MGRYVIAIPNFHDHLFLRLWTPVTASLPPTDRLEMTGKNA